eukprot:gnl/MRDRNA2_/MRDRNA2_80442_c0_seq2.p1 gnl/MRDRNA2_/MRDRNA2_80442_c0~~gnl/MRDRNA2_/MRDRNA2_80442_c0_seq2.p1  ORF type:complete len:383 (-),score=35.95 gnl/MRDRNA2_/MRDRNA2_80442_c0_seq2:125-1273(-)
MLELANTAWSLSTISFADRPLMAAISSSALRKMADSRAVMCSTCSLDEVTTLGASILGILHSFHLLDVLSPDFCWISRRVLQSLSNQMDKNCVKIGAIGATKSHGKSIMAPDVFEPTVVHENEDLYVVHKPPNWQVDTQDVGSAHRLSQFIQHRLAENSVIAFDPSHSFGILHRLDTPGSGLILVARTYMAYYDLRWQLTLGKVERDYVALLHGHVDPSITEIAARLRYARADGAAPSEVGRMGKPALTHLKVLAHCRAYNQCFSLVVLRIGTGRRHQIRAHTAHIGHPTVCDWKYAPDLAASDMEWCDRNFLHRYRLGFADACGATQDVVAALPGDLQRVLSEVQPCTEHSAVALQEWLSGHGARDWACHAPLQVPDPIKP